MGQQAAKVPPRLKVPKGKTRLCVAGFGLSHHTNRAGAVVRAIVNENPEEYESWFYFNSKGYKELLPQIKSELTDDQKKKFADHKSAPFCWLEFPDGTVNAKGGRDGMCEWVLGRLSTQRYLNVCGLARSVPTIAEVMVDKTPGTAAGQRAVE